MLNDKKTHNLHHSKLYIDGKPSGEECLCYYELVKFKNGYNDYEVRFKDYIRIVTDKAEYTIDMDYYYFYEDNNKVFIKQLDRKFINNTLYN